MRFIWLLMLGLLLFACSTPPTPLPTPMSPTALPASPASSVFPSSTPTLTKTPRPTRTPTLTPAQTDTPVPTPTPLPAGAATPTATLSGVEDAPAPFDIELPEGWHTQLYQLDVIGPDGGRMPLKVAIYSGKTPSHEALITVLWDYPTIWQDVWRDGVELVQVVFDASCHFNLLDTTPKTFTLGLHYAEGITYHVTACEVGPEVVGWLLGYRRASTNYLVYVSIAPVEGASEDRAFVQSILETVRFPAE